MEESIYWTSLRPNPLKTNSDGTGFLIKSKDYEFCRKAVEIILSYFGKEYSITDYEYLDFWEAWVFETNLPRYEKYVVSEIYKKQCNGTPLASITKEIAI